MTDTHEFVADWYRPASCVNCGQKRDHSIHIVEEAMTTDTHESDEQFVKRLLKDWANHTPVYEGDMPRLLSLALRGAAVRWRPTHRHVKRGSTYFHFATAQMQTSMPLQDSQQVEVYQDEGGGWWVRPSDEFFDGRFTALGEPAND